MTGTKLDNLGLVVVGGGGGGQPFDPTPLQNEDKRLQGEINKTNAGLITVNQTANNALQKATDNEQGITDLENLTQDHNTKIIQLQNSDTQQNQLLANTAKTNFANNWTVEQTFPFAKVNRVPAGNESVVNWGILVRERDALQQTITNNYNNTAKLNTQNTFTQVQRFDRGLVSSFNATGNNDVPNLGTVKSAFNWPFPNNGTFNYGYKNIKNKPVKQFYFQGAVNFRNGKAVFKGGVDLAINPNIYISINNIWVRFPFYDVGGLMGKLYIENNDFTLEVPGLNSGQNVKGFMEFTEI